MRPNIPRCSGSVSSVEFDFEKAGYDCAKRLIGDGKTGIVFLGDTPPWNAPANGIRRAFREAEIPLNEKLFLPRTGEMLNQFRTLLNFGFPVQAVYNAVYLYTEIRDILEETSQDCLLIGSHLSTRHDPGFRGIVLQLDFERLAKEEMRILRTLLTEPQTPPETVRIPITCSVQS